MRDAGRRGGLRAGRRGRAAPGARPAGARGSPARRGRRGSRSSAPCSARPPRRRLRDAPWARALQPIGRRRTDRRGAGARRRARPTRPTAPPRPPSCRRPPPACRWRSRTALLEEELRQVGRRLSLTSFQLHNLFDISRELAASQDEERHQGARHHRRDGPAAWSRAARSTCSTARSWWSRRSAACGWRRRVGAFPAPPRRRCSTPSEGRGRSPTCPRALCESGCSATGWRSPCRCRWASGPTGCWRWASARPVPRSPKRTATSRSRWAGRRWRRSRACGSTASAPRRSGRTARCSSRGRSSGACSRGRRRMPGFALAAVSVPSQEVGGDHYDFIPLPGGRVALAVADVSGKGTPASLLMASVHASLRALAGTAAAGAAHGAPVALPVRQHAGAPLRDHLLRRARPRLAHARLRERRTRAALSAAQQRGGGAPDVRRSRAGPARDSSRRVRGGKVALRPGDVLAIVTDGVTEACSPADAEFGERRLFETLRAVRRRGRGGDAGGDRGLRPRLDRAGGMRETT